LTAQTVKIFTGLVDDNVFSMKVFGVIWNYYLHTVAKFIANSDCKPGFRF